MEASGLSGGAEGAPEATQTGNEQVETQAPARDDGLDQLSQKFDGFLQDFTSRFEALEERFAEPEEEPEPEWNPAEQYFGEDGQLTPEDLQQWIDQAAEKKAQQFVSPIQQQMQEAQARAEQERLERAADELEERYPEIGEDGFQERLVAEAQRYAVAVAQAMGNPEAAEIIWKQPEVLENTYLAMKARERAANEVPAGSDPGYAMERGNTLSPSGAGVESDEDIVKRIVNARG